MTDKEMHLQLALALGRPIDGPGERRLAEIIGALLVGGGPVADDVLITTCDLLARLMARGQVARCPVLRPLRPGG